MGNQKITVWADPGKTTGIASWDSRYQVFTSLEISNDLKAVGHWVELLTQLNSQRMISDEHGNRNEFRIEIGWERYIVTPGGIRHGTPYWSLETIGILKYLALKYDLTILPPQLSSMMSVIPDEKLKKLSWYKPGKPHANDASRHLARYMLKTDSLPVGIRDKISGNEIDPGRLA